jgi:hypothetical protein
MDVERMRAFKTSYVSPMKAHINTPSMDEPSTPRDTKKQRR